MAGAEPILKISEIPDEFHARKKFRQDFLKQYGGRWASELASQVGEDPRIDYADFVNISDIVWTAREASLPVQNQYSPSDLSKIGDPKEHWAVAIMLLQAARFDFNYNAVRKIGLLLDKKDEHFGEFTAFEMFAAMASPHFKVEEEQIEEFLKTSRPDKIQHLLLHGMWLAPSGEYADSLVWLSNQVIHENPTDVVAHLRLAEGYRRKNSYGDAIRTLDRGIEINSPSETKMHDDFTRQRIVTTQEAQIWHTLRRHQDSLEQQVIEYGEKLRNEQYVMLFRIVEILALFFAIVGIFATSISLASLGELSGSERVLIIGAGGVILVLFILLLHFILRPKNDRKWQMRRLASDQKRMELQREDLLNELMGALDDTLDVRLKDFRQELE